MELVLTITLFVLSIAVGVAVMSFLTKRYGSRPRNTLFAGATASAFFLIGMWFVGF